MSDDGASKNGAGDDPLLLPMKLDDKSEYSHSSHGMFVLSAFDIVVFVVR